MIYLCVYRLRVCETEPRKAALLLQEMTELEIKTDYEDDDEAVFSSDEEDTLEISGLQNNNASPTEKNSVIQSFWNIFTPKQPTDPENELKLLMKKHLLCADYEGYLRVQSDKSIGITSICKMSKSSFNHSQPSFFGVVTFIDTKKDTGGSANQDEKVITKMFVKVILSEDVEKETIYFSPLMMRWKGLEVGKKVVLKPLPYNTNMLNNVVGQLDIGSNTSEDFYSARDLLSSINSADLNIFENLTPLEDSLSSSINFSTENEFVIITSKCNFSKQAGSKARVKHLKLKHTFHSPNIPTLTCFQQSLHDECQQYLYSSLNLMKCPCRPQHLLVTGPSGIGKTTFISNLTENLAFSKFQICSAYINCVTLKGKRPDVIKNKIQEAIKYLQGLSPSILILDNLDSIAGPVDEERQADDSSANFPVWMKDFLRSTTEACSKTLVIASAESIENLHPTLHTKKGSHPLLKSVTLNPPSADERIKMIKFCLELDNIQFNNQTIEGFYPCDIRKICEKMSLGDLSPADISRQIEEFIPISKWGKSLKPKLKRNIDNVGGLAEAKETLLQTILWPTKFRHIFNKIGVKMPKGVLLYGVPGSGKTLLAESFANFSSLNFIQVKGPELLSKYIGASEGNVRDLFLRAQAAKPCLIFFDEFDSLGKITLIIFYKQRSIFS